MLLLKVKNTFQTRHFITRAMCFNTVYIARFNCVRAACLPNVMLINERNGVSSRDLRRSGMTIAGVQKYKHLRERERESCAILLPEAKVRE